MRKTAAIVVTYNRSEMLKECISNLLQSKEKADLFIIDNASTDQTREVVRNFEKEGNVFYYNTGANLGGAGGFNYGINVAYQQGYEYFWLMDDDTMVQEDTLTELFEAVKHTGDSFGFLSSLAVWTDGMPCEMNKHEVLSDVRTWNRDKINCQYGLVRIVRATFVSFLINRKAVKTYGLPIKEYFIWGDDTEYSLRLSGHLPCYYVSRSIVVHKMKSNQASSNLADMEDPERIKRMACSIRNDFCTYRRQGLKSSIRYHKRVLKLLINVIINGKDHKMKKTAAVITGWWKGLFFHPRIEKV